MLIAKENHNSTIIWREINKKNKIKQNLEEWQSLPVSFYSSLQNLNARLLFPRVP